jgi:hypothetical protein
LGTAVRDITFARDSIPLPTLSAQHFREIRERTAGPVLKVVELLSAADPAKLVTFRREFDALVTEDFADNIVTQDYLMTRATKV